MIRMVAADALADYGLVAWEAGDADEALELLKQHPSISLLFTDVNLPGDLSGIELARRVHEERPTVELVITSGGSIVANDDLPDHGTFIRKPYPIDRLLQIVATKLEGHEKA